MLVTTVNSRNAVAPAPPRHPLLPFVLPSALVILGLIGGLGAARLLAGDPHTARSERLIGTVTWSNEQTRLIAFNADGAVRGPLDGATIYSVIAHDWQDAKGTFHATGEYPSCLASDKDSPVSMDRHRVELDVLHRDAGGQPQHIAVHVHCLD